MNKKIIITGATGFVGKKLSLALLKKGYDLVVLTRNIERAKNELSLPAEYIQWTGGELGRHPILENSHALIHLAGENIADGRWSKERKDAIMKSRKDGTRLLVESLMKLEAPPKIIVGTSAVGIFGDRKDEILNEASPNGEGFLSEVCKEWENSYQGFKGQVSILRVGVVLGNGGALDKMLLPFRLGLGGKLGNGKQWMSWIHINDLVSMYIHALENDSVNGIYNAVAPTPVTNSEFTNSLCSSLSVPQFLPVPKQVIRLAFGEMSEVVLGSQRVSSIRIEDTGFKFKFKSLRSALDNLLRPDGKVGCHFVEFAQWVPKKRSEVFVFFSEAENLETITPKWLNFHIKKKSMGQIAEGCLIDYRLKIKGVPASWRTLISVWKPGEKFVDEQLKGPYKIWHHTHEFFDLKDGTLLTDRVVYKAPLGPIGSLVEFLMIRNDVRKIFKHRRLIVDKIFGSLQSATRI